MVQHNLDIYQEAFIVSLLTYRVYCLFTVKAAVVDVCFF